MEITSWQDVVIIDSVGVEGLTLSQALLKYAAEFGQHDQGIQDDEPCHCVFCQTFAPMARELERQLDIASK